MKLQHTVFLWRVANGQKVFRTFIIGEVNLDYFNSDFTADGAVHEEFRFNDDKTALKYFVAIIDRLFEYGYTFDDIHHHLLGVEHYPDALDILRERTSSTEIQKKGYGVF